MTRGARDVTLFRYAQSGLVHLSAVKKDLQLDIKPLPVLSKAVRARSRVAYAACMSSAVVACLNFHWLLRV